MGKKCPILRLKNYLKKQKLWDEEKEAAFQEHLTEAVNQAIENAKGTAKPPLESLIQDVYFEVPSLLKNELEELRQEDA